MIAKFVKSLGYALKGISMAVKSERNVRIDIVAMIYVLYFSHFYNFTRAEKSIIILLCFNVLAFELINTAVERAVNRPDAEHYMAAGQAKDAAAGGVLLAAIGAAVTGVVLFWDTEVFKIIINHFITDPFSFMLLAVSLVFAYLFIVYDTFKKKK